MPGQTLGITIALAIAWVGLKVLKRYCGLRQLRLSLFSASYSSISFNRCMFSSHSAASALAI